MSPVEVASFIAQSFTLVIPIFLAGLILILSLQRNYFSSLDIAIDGGKGFRKKHIFGQNKTWRGVLIYLVGTTVVCSLLWLIADIFPYLVHPIFTFNPLTLGFALSITYVTGELINSFVKRRYGIDAGSSSGSRVQAIVDNIDGISLVAVMLFLFFGVSISYLLVAGLIAGLIHISTDSVMNRLGLK